MTPEHLSELQNILAFLRENDFKQSEASLIAEVQGLMEAAERERDRATRRDEGNNDDAADDPSEGAEARPSSPPRALARFGSSIEQTFAAMGDDPDALERDATGDDDDDDDGSSVDTFATPAVDFASRVAPSVDDAHDSDPDDGDISAAAFAHARDDPPPRAISLAAAIDALALEDDDDEHDHHAVDSDANSVADSASDADAGDVSFAAEVPAITPAPARPHPPSAYSSCVGAMDPDAHRALANEWQTRPLEEYDDDEDPGYARELVPPEDQLDFARREVDEWRDGEAVWDVPLPTATIKSETETETETDANADADADADANWNATSPGADFDAETDPLGADGDASRSGPVAVAPPKTEAPPDFFSRAMQSDLTVRIPVEGETGGETRGVESGVSNDAGEGFAFDKSPSNVGSATPASETSAPALGWGGSEFGGSSHAASPLPGATGDATPRSPGREEPADLDSAADALRAWAATERRDERESPGESIALARGNRVGQDESHDESQVEDEDVEDERREYRGDVGAGPEATEGEAEETRRKNRRSSESPTISSPRSPGASSRIDVFSGYTVSAYSSASPSAVDRSTDSVGATEREDATEDEAQAEDAARARAGAGAGAEPSLVGAAGYESFTLRVIHRARRTGFEEHKDFPARIGSIVAGRYEIVDHLGSAAFSKAVQARDLQTGMSVCLKIVKNSKDFFDQSLDEVKLLKLVNERDPGDAKGILRLYDYFYHAEHLFIVTELLRANLYEFQKFNVESGDETYFTLPAIKSVARQVLTSLAFMHSLDLIHCDLKPENILVKSYSKCEVKVIDLGSSCYVTDHLSSYVQSRSYRAPEVILGAPYDAKVDVWSLGCILAELHTGEVLFHNDSLASLLARCAGVLGPFDPELLRRGKHARDFFTKSGRVYERDEDAGTIRVLRPKRTSLAARLGLAGEGGEGGDGRSNPAADDGAGFVDFLLALLRPNPSERLTAEEALAHPWLASEDRRATRGGDAKERALASQL